jgi:ribosomal protein S14
VKKMARKKKIERIHVRCLVCCYEWDYSRGFPPKYRVKCPRCGSTRNDLNRKAFGIWRPEANKK